MIITCMTGSGSNLVAAVWEQRGTQRLGSIERRKREDPFQ